MANLQTPKDEKRRNSIWLIAQGGKPVTDDYELGRQLGEPGQFGRAVIAVHKKSKEQFACKIISKIKFSRYESGLEQLKREIEIMKRLKHDHLIRFQDVYEDKENLYIVMEMCTGGELFERIQANGAYNEKDASRLLRQLFQGLLHMHKNGIAHCDLKPDNFLLTTPSLDAPIKIIDFGLSKFIKHRQYFTKFVGTPYYVAPEVLAGHYNESCDIWSLGVVMFVMLFGYPPFYADARKWGTQTDRKIFQLIRKGFDATVKPGYGPHFPAAIPISESARDLIAKLLVPSPKRPTAEEALNHAWLRGETATSSTLDPLVMKGLKEFTAQTKFKQAVLRLMTDMLSEDEVANLKKTFTEMDENGDGSISVAELKHALERLKEKGGNPNSDVMQIIKAADIDGDGKIDYNELLSTFVDRKLNAKEERMFVAFSKLDQNGDGRISADELEGVLKKEHVFSADDHDSVTKLLKEADKDGDGKIDYEEFLTIMWAKRHPDDAEEEKQMAAERAKAVATTPTATAAAPKAEPKSTAAAAAQPAQPAATAVAINTTAGGGVDVERKIISRTINTSKSSTLWRSLSLLCVVLAMATFIVSLAIRMWFANSRDDVQCGLWSCCNSGTCADVEDIISDDAIISKYRAVRAFVILAFLVSLVTFVLALAAYFFAQDRLARFVAPFMALATLFGVIGFAIFAQMAKDEDESDNLSSGFALCVVGSIASFLAVLLGWRANATLVAVSESSS